MKPGLKNRSIMCLRWRSCLIGSGTMAGRSCGWCRPQRCANTGCPMVPVLPPRGWTRAGSSWCAPARTRMPCGRSRKGSGHRPCLPWWAKGWRWNWPKAGAWPWWPRTMVPPVSCCSARPGRRPAPPTAAGRCGPCRGRPIPMMPARPGPRACRPGLSNTGADTARKPMIWSGRMRRIISVWLPRWPTDRRRQKQAPAGTSADAGPLALTHQDGSAQRLYAINEAADRIGLEAGMTLAAARAILPTLETAPADPEGDKAALERLAYWAVRYSPLVGIESVDTLFIDATGCAHLFGGEAAMLADIEARLARAGIQACMAMADTPGAAWALSRYRPRTLAPVGETVAALAGLPVKALRLDDASVLTLGRLGLKTIGSLSAIERPALARRFQGVPAKAVTALLERLDQATGRRHEPIDPLLPLPGWQVRQAFMEPVAHTEVMATAVRALIEDLCLILQEAGQGVRRLQLSAFRVDGTVATCAVGTSRPNRDAAHLMKLMAERLDDIDAGFGIDLLLLAARDSERLGPEQLGDRRVAEMRSVAELMDRLSARLGGGTVSRLRHRPGHLPERAQTLAPVGEDRLGWDQLPAGQAPRPLRLLMRPEPIEVLAEVPEGPPRSFRWRRALHRIARAEGPERIAPEWWLNPTDHTRDYYRVEDEEGVRFWLFRHGLYAVPGVRGAELPQPVWYLHGLFA
ncbi:MAG: DNA polymerase Y family protein [Alphaproteobacteria bacterium]|nr:MAG: DNA polymerase Y family protein [Alphaproteobacteria bacterium]